MQVDQSLYAPIATLTVGVLAAVFAFWGIQSQRGIARRRATLDFIMKSETDGDMIKARLRFIELSKDVNGLGPWAALDKEKTDEAQKIKLILNEFELIAIGIKRGIIDKQLYCNWFKSGAIKHWDHAEPFVNILRSRTGNNALYIEFQQFVMSIDSKRGNGIKHKIKRLLD